MQLQARPSGPLSGQARPPGDKSISHRALILAAMAEGVSEIEGLLQGEDVLRTAAAIGAFGAEIDQSRPGIWRITGRGAFAQPSAPLDCGNSGTGVRLLMGAAAGYPIEASFDGDSSLRKRPMARVTAPLAEMGARFRGQAERLPLTLRGGALTGITYRTPVASAQIKSALLLAGLNADGETIVIEPQASRDHTERMLAAFGAEIDAAEGAPRVRRSRLHGAAVRVPADPSSAAFPIVAALIVPGSSLRLENVLLNPLRAGLFETLREMGADLRVENAREQSGEPIGDLLVAHSALKGIVVPPERAPSMIDEYPILAAAAAFAEGETIMRGIGEMRVKESDRIALMVAGLRACDVDAEEEPEGMIVRGTGAPPRGGASVGTQGDHRIAMSHLVLGLAARAPVTVDEAGMIETSFPNFAAFMRALGAEIQETA